MVGYHASMIPEDPYGEIQMLISELPDSANRVLAKSKEFRAAGDVDFAFELLRHAVERDPAPMLLVEHADLLASEGRTEEAVQQALAAIKDAPSGKYAREVLRRALLNGLPGSTVQLAAVARDFVVRRDTDYAEELLCAAVEREPEQVVLREQLAQLYATQHRISECIEQVEMILAVQPEHEQAQLMLAAAFLKQGDLPRAQKLLDRARRRGVSGPFLDELEAKIGEVIGVISRSKSSAEED